MTCYGMVWFVMVWRTLHHVTREEWEACRVDQEKPRILAICDQPNQFMYFTITFRYDMEWWK